MEPMFRAPSSLEHKWQKRFDPSLIGGILVGKVTQEEIFFLLQLDPEANEEKQESHEGNQQAGRNSGAQPHEQMAGVNGMTHESIRAAFHKFVPLFQLDVSAPIAPKRFARPDGREQACGTDHYPQILSANDMRYHRMPTGCTHAATSRM